MAETQDVTENLSRLLSAEAGAGAAIESIRHATIRLDDLPVLVRDPKRIAAALGVPVAEHSRWTVSLVERPAALATFRPVTVIIVHFSDCHGVIVVFY